MKSNLKLKKTLIKKQIRTRWNIDRLKIDETKIKYQIETDQKLKELQTDDSKESDIEKIWKNINSAIGAAAGKVIGKSTQAKRKLWMTEEILLLMDERRKYKNDTSELGKLKYKSLKNKINRICKETKMEWWNLQCQALETLEKQGKSDLVYRKVNEMTKNYTGIKTTAIKDENGKEAVELRDKKKVWQMYVEKLYEDVPWKWKPKNICSQMEDSIMREEFDRALKILRINKAPGNDNIPAELLKNSGKKMQDELFKLVSEIYRECKWPADRSLIYF